MAHFYIVNTIEKQPTKSVGSGPSTNALKIKKGMLVVQAVTKIEAKKAAKEAIQKAGSSEKVIAITRLYKRSASRSSSSKVHASLLAQ